MNVVPDKLVEAAVIPMSDALTAYNEGYENGYENGYDEGWNDALIAIESSWRASDGDFDFALWQLRSAGDIWKLRDDGGGGDTDE